MQAELQAMCLCVCCQGTGQGKREGGGTSKTQVMRIALGLLQQERTKGNLSVCFG